MNLNNDDIFFKSKSMNLWSKKTKMALPPALKKHHADFKGFFSLKSDDNHISITYSIKSHEDGLR